MNSMMNHQLFECALPIVNFFEHASNTASCGRDFFMNPRRKRCRFKKKSGYVWVNGTRNQFPSPPPPPKKKKKKKTSKLVNCIQSYTSLGTERNLFSQYFSVKKRDHFSHECGSVFFSLSCAQVAQQTISSRLILGRIRLRLQNRFPVYVFSD